MIRFSLKLKINRQPEGTRLDLDRVKWTLSVVNWFQALWMLFVGILLIVAPSSRFATPSWQFIEYVDGGDNIAGAMYVVIGTLLVAGLITGRDKVMAYALLMGGLLNWAMALFLIAGALHGTTGALGGPFCLYVGVHMLLVSVMFTKRKGG